MATTELSRPRAPVNYTYDAGRDLSATAGSGGSYTYVSVLVVLPQSGASVETRRGGCWTLQAPAGRAYAGGDPVNRGDPSGLCPGEWYCPFTSAAVSAWHHVYNAWNCLESACYITAQGFANAVAGAENTINSIAGLQAVAIPYPCNDVGAYDLGGFVPYAPLGVVAPEASGEASIDELYLGGLPPDAEAGAGSGFEIVGSGTVTRTIDFTPDATDPNWGLTWAHLDKHLFGSGNLSLSTIDPGATSDTWLSYIQELAGQPATTTLKGGIEDIIGAFPKANGTGTFQFGIRIAPNGDGTYSLVTLLTKQ